MQGLTREARAFLAAMVFFTRLPVPSRPIVDADDLRRAATWWPLLGLVFGGAMSAVLTVARPVFGASVAAGLAVLTGILMTGGLEEDGVADVSDGYGSVGTRTTALAAMRDSRVGAHGVVGVVMVLGLRWQTIASLPAGKATAAILASEAGGRAFSVALMSILPYVREGESKARSVVGRQSAPRLIIALATGLAPFFFGVSTVALLAGFVAWGACAIGFRRWLGGYTGDCVGATHHMCALAILLAALAAA